VWWDCVVGCMWQLCPNATGAEIRSVCSEAGMFAIRQRRKTVNEKDFLEAVNKVRIELPHPHPPSPVGCVVASSPSRHTSSHHKLGGSRRRLYGDSDTFSSSTGWSGGHSQHAEREPAPTARTHAASRILTRQSHHRGS